MSVKTAARLNRILAMLPWVIANPGSTVQELCERFGYSRSELLADLDLVFVCGLPGYGPGDLMVAYVEEDEVIVDLADYFDRPVRLAPAEALALLAAGMALVSSGQATPVLKGAVDKLANALLPDADDSLVVDLATEPELVSDLRDAAAAGEAVEIVYTSLSRDETTTRVVEPWSVFSSLGNWYLSGYCRLADAERVFRVDRIRALSETGDTFNPPDDLPPPTVGYTPSEDDVRAVIRLSPRAAWVAEYYPVDRLDGDTIEFSAADPLVAARLLLRLGQDAELLQGPEVAAVLAELRAKIAARYA